MHHPNSVITKAASGQGGLNLRAATYQKKSSNALILLRGSQSALDDDAAAVVATHDIHCNAHKDGEAAAPVSARAAREQVTLRLSL